VADTATLSWYVYIVRCADGSLYTGVTVDLDRRLNEHNGRAGNGARYTRSRRPVTLAYHEITENRSDACKREAEIKQMKRAQKEALLKTSD
jgi:putative endonuclease